MSDSIRNDENMNRAFVRGAACVLAVLTEEYGQPGMSADIMRGLGLNRRYFVMAQTEDHDMGAIEPAFKELER